MSKLNNDVTLNFCIKIGYVRNTMTIHIYIPTHDLPTLLSSKSEPQKNPIGTDFHFK